MAISLNALVTEIQSRVHRTDINTNIQNEILKIISRLEAKKYWPWKLGRSTAITLGSGTWTHALPSNFGADFAFNITETDKQDILERVAFDDFIRHYTDPSQESGGQPTKYTIGYGATAGVRLMMFPHPADGTYATELFYWITRTDATSTVFDVTFTELEKIYLIHKGSAIVKQQFLGYSDCTGNQTCHCDACESFRIEQDMEQRHYATRAREGTKWKHSKKTGTLIGQYDVRGNQKTYNV